MATPAQLDEKTRLKMRDGVAEAASPAQLVEKTERAPLESMATAAQLAQRKDSQVSSFEQIATPAQLAEKERNRTSAPSSIAATPAQLSEKAQPSPPPLPPRVHSAQQIPPPPYTVNDAKRNEMISQQWRSHDPRSSSTHSLVPSESGRDGRRTLLLVFIHGFMGTETSFQSFPAHIHNLLTITLTETHVVHTKIYPRYKSRKAIDFARDDFSAWLEPHENHFTEVILLGHSMGGILGAEVVLQKPQPTISGRSMRHRILGTVNFDTPFLGMHPGVIKSGLGSLFRPAPNPSVAKTPPPSSGVNTSSMASQVSPSSSSNALSIAESDLASQYSLVQSITSPTNPQPNSPFFNPPFPNDVRLPERKGWTNALHFINKHSDDLANATKDYFLSHLEFGGCMADYSGLKNRYQRIRALEDINDLALNSSEGLSGLPARVRFVNYYTTSTGVPKTPKAPPSAPEITKKALESHDIAIQSLSLEQVHRRSPPHTPRISVDEYSDGAITPQPLQTAPTIGPLEAQVQNLGDKSGVEDFNEQPGIRHIDSIPIEDDEGPEPAPETNSVPLGETIEFIKSIPFKPPLPELPPVPTEPTPINLNIYTDKDSRKIAEKEYKRVTKAYQQAVKDRESALKDRKKLAEKREKKARQEQEKLLKTEEKQRAKEKEEERSLATINAETEAEAPKQRKASIASSVKEDKPKKDKKFCMLPPKHRGERDKCWVRIFMEGVDEVGAHCGLFFSGPQYESLVGDVGARIGKWVEEDATRRAIHDAQNG
ncbi:hypothetical protein BGZ60DRAFT_399535 [Tricladium varicosporioides]|nr:hypothetical protein BGZ60DRAFT_399535 [Hymenoscyphus varicosporioides]